MSRVEWLRINSGRDLFAILNYQISQGVYPEVLDGFDMTFQEMNLRYILTVSLLF